MYEACYVLQHLWSRQDRRRGKCAAQAYGMLLESPEEYLRLLF